MTTTRPSASFNFSSAATRMTAPGGRGGYRHTATSRQDFLQDFRRRFRRYDIIVFSTTERWLRAARKVANLSRKETPPLVYSPFFATLHDETSPVGRFGRGTHYSVLRTVTWHDSCLNPLPNAEFLDFAIIWDDDPDTRVMMVVETMYFDGLLAPVRFIAERKGGLIVLVAPETAAVWDLPS